MTGNERDRYESTIAFLRGLSGGAIIQRDHLKDILSMDAHVRDIEAKLCRAREALKVCAPFVSNHIAEEHIEPALSSTAPCRHEEEVKRLKEAIEWACAWSCSVGEDNKLGYPFRQELRRRAKGE